jgi:PhnB protein
MSKLIQPYLFFQGRCDEAIEFYRTTIGAELLMLMRYSECPDPLPPEMFAPGWESKVMHASLCIGESVVMASDGCGGREEGRGFDGFSLSLTLPDEAAAGSAFTALAEGGKVTMPLGKTFWSPCFGMLEDRFGLGWMITVPEEKA